MKRLVFLLALLMTGPSSLGLAVCSPAGRSRLVRCSANPNRSIPKNAQSVHAQLKMGAGVSDLEAI